MSKKGKHHALWQFLEASGVLNNGTPEEIQGVRRQYRKVYMREYKSQLRKVKPEFMVQLSKHNGDYGKVLTAAKRHKMSVTAFLRLATIAYIERKYLIPNNVLVGKLAALLESCLNDIRVITEIRSRVSLFTIEEKYSVIEERITRMETEIRNLFDFPSMLEVAVSEAARTDAALRERLLTIINNAARKNPDSQTT